MDKLPPIITRKYKISHQIKYRIKDYIESFKTLEQEIDTTIPKIEPLEIGSKEVYPDYIFIGKSSTDQRKMRFIGNIIQKPIKEIIKEYSLKNKYNFENFMEKILPYRPRDRDYTIITNIELAHLEKDFIREYWINQIEITEGLSKVDIHSKSILGTNEFIQLINEFPYERPYRDHPKDLPFNSVILHSGDNEEINTLLEKIRFENGNPRFYEEFKIELKEFNKSIETSPWF